MSTSFHLEMIILFRPLNADICCASAIPSPHVSRNSPFSERAKPLGCANSPHVTCCFNISGRAKNCPRARTQHLYEYRCCVVSPICRGVKQAMEEEPPVLKGKPLVVILSIVFLDLVGVGILIPIVPILLAGPRSPYYVLPAGYTIQQGYILLGWLVAIYSIFQFLAAPIVGQ